MKRGKEDGEKLMGPLFPRLHVNDTPEKGGPRAPPRNKMALYEQLSVPSLRFRSDVASVPPIPLHNNGTIFSCASSSQGSGKEGSLLTSFCVQQASSYSTDKVHSRSSDGKNANATSVTFEPKFIKTDGFKASSSTSYCTSHQNKASKRKDFDRRQLRDEDDFMVPTFIESEANINKEKAALSSLTDSGTCTATAAADTSQIHMLTSCNCASQLWKSQEKLAKMTNIIDKNSRHSGKNFVGHGKQPAEEMQSGMVPVVDSIENITSPPNPGALPSERHKYMKSTQNQGQDSGSLNGDGNTINEAGPLGESNSVLFSYDNRCSEASTRAVDIAGRANSLRMSSECESTESPANCNGTPTGKSANEELQPDDRDKNDDLSRTMPMVVSASGLEISPDDVVGVIGPKQFWKARRAIMNQQRIFSLQVFELHRLIKVQKFLAGSPHLLLDDDVYSTTSPTQERAENQVVLDDNSRSQPPIMKQKPEPPKLSQSAELSAGHSTGKTVSMVDSVVDKGLTNHASSRGYSNANPSPSSVVIDSKSTPWCFPSVGTQWLVPVMSPSEGLVYKPFMTPSYGTCSPINLPLGGDLSNIAHGVPPSYQENGVTIFSGSPSYFPPYLPHVTNPMLCGRVASGQADVPPSNLLHGQADKFSAENTVNTLSRGSCNMQNPKVDAFSCHVQTIQASRETELQGSTASTSYTCEGVQETADRASEGRKKLPFSPGTLATGNFGCTGVQNTEQQTRVIKVVPHNAKYASESAARIFWSIQKQREQYD